MNCKGAFIKVTPPFPIKSFYFTFWENLEIFRKNCFFVCISTVRIVFLHFIIRIVVVILIIAWLAATTGPPSSEEICRNLTFRQFDNLTFRHLTTHSSQAVFTTLDCFQTFSTVFKVLFTMFPAVVLSLAYKLKELILIREISSIGN